MTDPRTLSEWQRESQALTDELIEMSERYRGAPPLEKERIETRHREIAKRYRELNELYNSGKLINDYNSR